jgi:hypothetical protein
VAARAPVAMSAAKAVVDKAFFSEIIFIPLFREVMLDQRCHLRSVP